MIRLNNNDGYPVPGTTWGLPVRYDFCQTLGNALRQGRLKQMIKLIEVLPLDAVDSIYFLLGRLFIRDLRLPKLKIKTLAFGVGFMLFYISVYLA